MLIPYKDAWQHCSILLKLTGHYGHWEMQTLRPPTDPTAIVHRCLLGSLDDVDSLHEDDSSALHKFLDISVVYQLDVEFFTMQEKSKQADQWPWRVEFPPNLGFSMYLSGERKLCRDTLRQEEDVINKKKFYQVLSPLPCEHLHHNEKMSNAFRSFCHHSTPFL